jgi:hypothetical protein
MANKKPETENAAEATVGEAVGLVSSVEHEKVCEEWARSEADATEKAGQLADLADALFDDDERALKHGYAGMMERVKILRGFEEAAPGLREAAREAMSTRDLAVRETVGAKGLSIQYRREIDALKEANAALSAEGERLRAQGNLHWSGLKEARARVEAQARRIAQLERCADEALTAATEAKTERDALLKTVQLLTPAPPAPPSPTPDPAAAPDAVADDVQKG